MPKMKTENLYKFLLLISKNQNLTMSQIFKDSSFTYSSVFLFSKELEAKKLIICQRTGRTKKIKLTQEGICLLKNLSEINEKYPNFLK